MDAKMVCMILSALCSLRAVMVLFRGLQGGHEEDDLKVTTHALLPGCAALLLLYAALFL